MATKKKAADQGVVDFTEQKRLNEAREAGIPWKKWGPVPQRAAVGHGPRGLQPRRQRLGLLHPRPVALARLPLGRGRPRRDLRRQAAPVLRARPLERARPDPQGARVRPDQQRGEPRRGRQGVLLLRRLDADALVHEVPLQVPAAGVPLPGPGRDEPRARSREEFEYELLDTGDLRRRPVLRRLRRVRQGGAGGHPDPHLASTTAGRRRRGCTCCRRSGSGTRGRGATRRRRSRSCATKRGAIVASHPELGEYTLSCERRARAALHREREQRAAPLGPAEPVAVREGRVPPVRRRRARRTRSTRRSTGTKAAAHYVARRAGGRLRGRPLCASRRGPASRAVRSGFRRRRSGSGSPTPTSSTSGSRRPRSARTSAASTGRRSPGCSGRSSTTTSTSTAG